MEEEHEEEKMEIEMVDNESAMDEKEIPQDVAQTEISDIDKALAQEATDCDKVDKLDNKQALSQGSDPSPAVDKDSKVLSSQSTALDIKAEVKTEEIKDTDFINRERGESAVKTENGLVKSEAKTNDMKCQEMDSIIKTENDELKSEINTEVSIDKRESMDTDTCENKNMTKDELPCNTEQEPLDSPTVIKQECEQYSLDNKPDSSSVKTENCDQQSKNHEQDIQSDVGSECDDLMNKKKDFGVSDEDTKRLGKDSQSEPATQNEKESVSNFAKEIPNYTVTDTKYDDTGANEEAKPFTAS